MSRDKSHSRLDISQTRLTCVLLCINGVQKSRLPLCILSPIDIHPVTSENQILHFDITVMYLSSGFSMFSLGCFSIDKV